jgi:hypothetical protein
MVHNLPALCEGVELELCPPMPLLTCLPAGRLKLFVEVKI